MIEKAVKGEIIKCISNPDRRLITVGRLYVVKSNSGPHPNYVYIINDAGADFHYEKQHFISIIKP